MPVKDSVGMFVVDDVSCEEVGSGLTTEVFSVTLVELTDSVVVDVKGLVDIVSEDTKGSLEVMAVELDGSGDDDVKDDVNVFEDFEVVVPVVTVVSLVILEETVEYCVDIDVGFVPVSGLGVDDILGDADTDEDISVTKVLPVVISVTPVELEVAVFRLMGIVELPDDNV